MNTTDIEYEVKEIVMRCEIEGYVEYLVKWMDDTETWEPEENLKNCQELVREFNKTSNN